MRADLMDLVEANDDLVGRTSSGQLSTAPEAVAMRREAFCQYYVSNGGNATRAYIRAGYAPENANTQSRLLMRDAKIIERIAQIRVAGSKTMLEIDEVLKQMRAIVTFDPRKMIDDEGKPVPLHLLDEDTALALKGLGAEAWSKERAIDMAMKHLGGYEKDNRQKAECLAIQVIVER